jgi:hypothetical protein
VLRADHRTVWWDELLSIAEHRLLSHKDQAPQPTHAVTLRLLDEDMNPVNLNGSEWYVVLRISISR